MSKNPYADRPYLPTFSLASDDVTDGQPLARAQVSGLLGAGGEDVSPHLTWSGAPAETRSYAITIFDPDAPTLSGFWHWAVFNLPASTDGLASNASAAGLPEGAIQLRNDGGTMGYVGAAPPPGHGTHHYWIAVHALDLPMLELPAEGSIAYLDATLFAHSIARATLVGTHAA